jgi:FkbM family methyltransferase
MDLGHLAANGRSTTWTAWATNPVRRALWWLAAPYFHGAGVEVGRYVAAEIDRHVTAEIDRKSQAALVSTHDAIRTAISSQLGGVCKDAMAVAHRLAGLEEEAAMASEARTAIANRVDLLVQARDDLSAYIAALQKDVRSDIRALNERIDYLARGASLGAGNRVSVGPGSLVIIASPGGTHYLARQHDLIGRLIVDGREWEPHVRMEIERAARPDGVAVDAGAYIGVHTLAMSRWFRTVHAFEPQRGIFQMLCGNLALNGRLNVVAHNAALYDRAGSMRLSPKECQEVNVPTCDGQLDYEQIENAAALSFDFVADGNGDVPAIRLDDMALDKVALIKVDAQGADLRVLRGAEGTIARWQPIVLFEWERDLGVHHGGVLEDYYAFFGALGYDVAMLQETTPGRQADYIARPRK